MPTLVPALLKPGRLGPVLSSCLAAMLLALAVPAGALAAGSAGVHVDPGSPAAKEYQIPLGAARGNGQSGGSSGRQLFGSGITGGGHTGGGASSAAATANQTKPTAVGSPVKRPGVVRPAHARRHPRVGGLRLTPLPSVASPARAIGTTSSSGAGITWMLGAAVIVLLLGGLGGSLLARRGRRTSPYPS